MVRVNASCVALADAFFWADRAWVDYLDERGLLKRGSRWMCSPAPPCFAERTMQPRPSPLLHLKRDAGRSWISAPPVP
jgi:hypothetical protein